MAAFLQRRPSRRSASRRLASGERAGRRGRTIRPMAIYLDHAATTPLRREVLDAMLPYLTEAFGNPSSAHAFGRTARAALDEAHERVAARLHAEPREIVFTSGGTEANNLALKGAAWAGKAHGHRIVTSAIEHHAVGHTLRYLEKFGFEVVELPVDRYGRVDPDQLEAALTDRTILVSIMLANNEVGTIQPIAEIAKVVRAHKGVLFHVDAVQAAPYVDLDVAPSAPTSSRSAPTSSRGPRASARCTSATAPTSSPSSRAGRRSAIAGRARRTWPAPSAWPRPTTCPAPSGPRPSARLRRQRERLAKAILATPGTETTGHPKQRLPGLLSIIARDTDGVSVAMSLDLEGIACSVGSACTTGSTEVSHVLTAMGYPEEEARGALRLSLGRTTTDDEIADGLRGRAAGPRLDAPRLERRSPPTRSGRRSAHEPHPRGDVGRGRLVRRRGARPASRATTSSASGCACTTSPTRIPSSRRAAARSTPPTTPAGSPRSSTSRSTS